MWTRISSKRLTTDFVTLLGWVGRCVNFGLCDVYAVLGGAFFLINHGIAI